VTVNQLISLMNLVPTYTGLSCSKGCRMNLLVIAIEQISNDIIISPIY